MVQIGRIIVLVAGVGENDVESRINLRLGVRRNVRDVWFWKTNEFLQRRNFIAVYLM
jgi:hypothetical protein